MSPHRWLRFAGAIALAACGNSAASSDAQVPIIDAPIVATDANDANDARAALDAPDAAPTVVGLGAHALSFHRLTEFGDRTTITTPAMSTASAGSTIVVSIGRGMLDAFALSNAAPTDNMGNTAYPQIDLTHKYKNWPSGTGLYALSSARGGTGHTITAATPLGDEITLAAVEVVGRTRVQDHVWNEVLDGTLKSRSVTTTGPATLIAFWWGDGFVESGYTAVPNNGFEVIDAVLEGGSLVQCAVAVKSVTAAGTYDVTWTASPAQGAQLYLVAVE